MKGHVVNGKITLHILTNADCALLPVQQLKSAVVALYPIHNIERKVFANGTNHFVPLLVLVDKLPLKRWANVQFAAIAHNAIFRAVYVAIYNIPYGDFMQFDFHCITPASYELSI